MPGEFLLVRADEQEPDAQGASIIVVSFDALKRLVPSNRGWSLPR
jgi:hypothetical protein